MADEKRDELEKCREAFEKWYFPYRNECWNKNILLDANDANSIWSGWEAAWNSRTPAIGAEALEKVREALKDAFDFVECDTLRHNREISSYAKRICKSITEALALLAPHGEG